MLFEKTQHLAERSTQRLYAIMSFSYVGAMLCSNYALQYISYPAQVILLSILWSVSLSICVFLLYFVLTFSLNVAWVQICIINLYFCNLFCIF